MLVLKRKPGESIQVGNGITITILGTESGAVRVGIDAPRDVAICRTELLPEIKANIAARAGGEPTGAVTDAD
jgi:carbon storage regulator